MLELYQAEGCPFCEKVRQRMTELGVSYVAHNPRQATGEVTNEQVHEELQQFGGKDQIPFLVDSQRQETLFESDDIVEHLDEHYA